MDVNGLDHVGRHHLAFGAFEPEIWEELVADSQPSDVLWDVGAHEGTVTLQAAQYGMETWSFEPNPHSFGILLSNLRLNGLPIDRVLDVAISDHDGHAAFDPGQTGNTGTAQLTASGALMVATRQADALVANGIPAPTLMKLDVEGAEEAVLRGASGILRDTPPRRIVFEADAGKDGKMLSHSLNRLLVNAGYCIRHIKRPEGKIEPKENYVADHLKK